MRFLLEVLGFLSLLSYLISPMT